MSSVTEPNTNENRRVLPRLTNYVIRESLTHRLTWLRLLMITMLLLAVVHLIYGLLFSPKTLAQGVFVMTIAVTVFVFIYNATQNIREYLLNESIGNLERYFEHQNQLWMLLSLLVILLAGVDLLFLFS